MRFRRTAKDCKMHGYGGNGMLKILQILSLSCKIRVQYGSYIIQYPQSFFLLLWVEMAVGIKGLFYVCVTQPASYL